MMCICSEEDSTAASSTTAAAAVAEGVRELKGVMRVGLLAKGLLLHGDLELQLVVLCHNRPTKSLLLFLAEKLPVELVVNVIAMMPMYFDVVICISQYVTHVLIGSLFCGLTWMHEAAKKWILLSCLTA